MYSLKSLRVYVREQEELMCIDLSI